MRVLSAAKGEVIALGFVPGRAALASAQEGNGIFVWDLASATVPPAIPTYSYLYPRALTFSPDGLQVVQRGDRCLVAVDLATGNRTDLEPGGTESIGDFCQSADGLRRVIAYGSTWTQKKLTSWRLSGAGWVEDWSQESEEFRHAGVALAPDGNLMAHFSLTSPQTWPRTYEVVVRDTTGGTAVGKGEYPYSIRTRMLFRPDGEQLIAIHEMTLLVWSIPKVGKPRLVRNDNRKHFTSAAFHPSSRYLFTTSNDATVLVWDTATWRHVSRFTWNIGRLRSVAVNGDGTLAAVGSDKGQVMLWDVDL